MQIKTFLLVGTVLSVSVAMVAAGGLYVTTLDVNQTLRKDEAARTIVKNVFERTLVMGDYLLHREQRARIQWEWSHGSLERLLDDPGFKGTESEQALAAMRANYRTTSEIFPRLVKLFATKGGKEASNELSGALERRLVGKLLTTSQATVSMASRLAEQAKVELDESLHRKNWLEGLLSVSLIIVLVGTWVIIARRMVRPLDRLRQGIQIFGAGDLDYRIDPQSNDEIGEIATTANEMARTLKETTVSRDELREAHVELEAVNKELEAFSYSVSHDLRAPLRGMDGFSHALLEDYGDKLDTEGRDYLQRVRAGSQRMAQLIDDLLKLSRINRGEFERREVDLSQLAQAVAAELRQTAPERQVTFDIAPGVTAEGGAPMIRIALENLLGNAWKFTAKHYHATIEFGVADQDGKAAYFVRDDGAGFDMAYADKLFQPFQRLHSGAEFGGTGIGLATVARVVHRHGGRVWAESGVEQGTTVYFTL